MKRKKGKGRKLHKNVVKCLKFAYFLVRKKISIGDFPFDIHGSVF